MQVRSGLPAGGSGGFERSVPPATVRHAFGSVPSLRGRGHCELASPSVFGDAGWQGNHRWRPRLLMIRPGSQKIGSPPALLGSHSLWIWSSIDTPLSVFGFFTCPFSVFFSKSRPAKWTILAFSCSCRLRTFLSTIGLLPSLECRSSHSTAWGDPT